VSLNRQGSQRRDGIDAAGGKQDEAGAVSLAVFEDVDRAGEVVVHEFARAGPAVHAREHARVGGGVHHEVGGG
jgi:hypothetical protein